MATTRKKVVTKPKMAPKAPPMTVRVVRTQSHFYKDQVPKVGGYERRGRGTFFLLFEITAGPDALYIPISIATGRKSAGFLYITEGDGVPTATASLIEKGGKDVTTVSSGSIVYTKIPPGRVGTFVLNAEVVGTPERSYRVIINTISYKTNPNDLRYKKFHTELSTDTLEFTSLRK